MLLIGIILLVLSHLSILFIFIIKKDSKESEDIVPSAVLGGTKCKDLFMLFPCED